MINIAGLVFSFLFIFLIIGLATLGEKYWWSKKEYSRKFIHIILGNWWFLALYFFDDWRWACSVPFLFVIINYISYKKQLFKSMERGAGKQDLGTVYYAISLLILTFISYYYGLFYIGGVGILIMAYGDGGAALVGQRFGRWRYSLFGQTKSIEGSLVVAIVAFGVFFVFNNYYQLGLTGGVIAMMALLAAGVEAVSPLGFDNLSLPLISGGLIYLFGQWVAG